MKYLGYEIEIDNINGEAAIYNEDGEQVDTVDLWDLLCDFHNAAVNRSKECIKASKSSYEHGFRISDV